VRGPLRCIKFPGARSIGIFARCPEPLCKPAEVRTPIQIAVTGKRVVILLIQILFLWTVWCYWGFSSKQAQSIVKVRQNGWIFRKKSDFSRLYVVSDRMYAKLEPYILLPDELETKRKIAEKIDLNTVTIEELMKLGVPEHAAKEIIEYRHLLGGYYSFNQLYEIYGISKSLIKRLYWQLTVDTTRIRKINLKTADFDILQHHPYINTYLATWIVARQKKNKFNSPRYILKSGQISRYHLYRKSDVITF